MSSKHRLQLLTRMIQNLCLRKGEFKLTSGRASEWYVDLKPAMFNSTCCALITGHLMQRIPVTIERVGGLAVGAIPLVAALLDRGALLNSRRELMFSGFFIRKEAKDHGTKSLIEGTKDLAGKRTAIIEDVSTTGQSAFKAMVAARDAGASVQFILTVVDREEGARELFAKEGIPFLSLLTLKDLTKD